MAILKEKDLSEECEKLLWMYESHEKGEISGMLMLYYMDSGFQYSHFQKR